MNNKISVSVVLIILLLFISCAAQPKKPAEDVQKEAEYYYKMGISSLNEGNLKMAYVQLHKAYELDQGNLDILNSLGIVFMKLGEDNKAMEFFKRVISIDNKYSEAYNNVGVIHLQNGRYKDAIEAFNNTLLNPLYKFPERGYYNLGNAYYRIGQYDKALKAFQTSIRLSPNFSLPYYGSSLVYNKKGNYGFASSMLTQAVALDERYKGNIERFRQDLKARISSRTADEDVYDYLEILNY
ncbi:MAG: tetratricopeptide repeat protein [Thermodesulfovibrionales bacterium]